MSAARLLRYTPPSGDVTGDVTQGVAWPEHSDTPTGDAMAETQASRSWARRVAPERGAGDPADQAEPPLVVPIETLAPASLDLIRPFHVNLMPSEEGFQATFVDANLASCGETRPEAIWNLKDLLVETFVMLTEVGEEHLGPGPLRQLAVLRQFIRR